jgi:hypothetical protein
MSTSSRGDGAGRSVQPDGWPVEKPSEERVVRVCILTKRAIAKSVPVLRAIVSVRLRIRS